MEADLKTPKLVASTGDTYCCSIAESRDPEEKLQNSSFEEEEKDGGKKEKNERFNDPEARESNYFKSIQWTPDGTSLLASNADNAIRTIILPPDLLENPSQTLTLTPYTTHHFPSSINCLTPYPHFQLSDPTTTLYLSAPTDLPIRLVNALSPDSTPSAAYSLVSPTTEAYLTPSSIVWSSPGNHFLTGTDCLISLFDVSRNGSGPVRRLPTIPSKRHKMKGGGVGMRGIVSALSIQSPGSGAGMLAAGTWTRWVGLYDAEGMGGTVAAWDIKEAADDVTGIGGTGVSQTGWSKCGRYLVVVERKSRGVLVYDVRVAGKTVCWLEGREAGTNQRLGVDVFEGEEGMEVWAGGSDSVVRVWEGVGKREGDLESSWDWKAHQDPVSSTVLHSTGTVVATCSGQRAIPEFLDDDEEGSSTYPEESNEERGLDSETPIYRRDAVRIPDNSIKVWNI